jgi:hypothetical protein
LAELVSHRREHIPQPASWRLLDLSDFAPGPPDHIIEAKVEDARARALRSEALALEAERAEAEQQAKARALEEQRAKSRERQAKTPTPFR